MCHRTGLCVCVFCRPSAVCARGIFEIITCQRAHRKVYWFLEPYRQRHMHDKRARNPNTQNIYKTKPKKTKHKHSHARYWNHFSAIKSACDSMRLRSWQWIELAPYVVILALANALASLAGMSACVCLSMIFVCAF